MMVNPRRGQGDSPVLYAPRAGRAHPPSLRAFRGLCSTRRLCLLLASGVPAQMQRRATGPWAAMRCQSVAASLEHRHGTRFVGFRRWLLFAGRVECGFSDRAIRILADPGWCLEKIFSENI